MKFYFKNDQKLIGEISFKKLGIVFRNISEQEKIELFDFFHYNIVNKSILARIKYFKLTIKNHNYDFNNQDCRKKFEKFRMWLTSRNKAEQDLFFYLVNLSENSTNNIFLKREIEHNLQNLKVIEVNESEFQKFYPKEYANYFLSRLSLITAFLANNSELFISSNKHDETLLNSENLNIENLWAIDGMFFCKNLMKVDINFNYLNLIANLLNTKDQYHCFHIASIIDALFNNRVSIENDIINKVSLIERLIIKESDNIEKQFILKVGMILKLGNFKTLKNPEKILKTIYTTRSYLVHGNEKKLFEQLKEIGEFVGVSSDELNEDKYNNKLKVLAAVKVFTELFLKEVLNFYIVNNNMCEYLKNN